MDPQILLRRFCDYATLIRGYTQRTARRYSSNTKLFFSSQGVTDIQQVSPEVVRTYFYHGRQARNWSVNTFRTYHKSLVVFFRWCVKEGYLAQSPMIELEVPKLEHKLPQAVSQSDALRLLEVVYHYPAYCNAFVRHRNYAILATFIFAGLRRQELLDLKYADVDLANRTLFVHQGKGSKDRLVPIAPKLEDILGRYQAERRKLDKTCPEFFTSWKWNKGMPDTTLRRLVADMRRASGIRFSAHRLRHAFATLMLHGGCDIYSLSRMMGHSNIQTTTIYLSATAEQLQAQITKHPLNK
jgi:site-specific recombinase XerD